MIRKMVPRAGVALTTALILSACGGGGGGSVTGSSPGESTQTALDYSYPLNQQTEVPTPAPVVLNFSNSISGSDVQNSITLHQGHNASGATVAVTAKITNNGKSLILTPDSKLAPHTDYAVVIAGSSTVKNRTIGFSTRALQEGPKSEVVSSDTMKLMGMFPDGSSNEPMMDFSTLRLRFSQPLDRSTVSYGNGQGDTVALIDDQSNVVPAHMIVDGPYLTIDPSQNLTPGKHYTLHFASNQVKSTYGQAFYYVDNSTYQLTPKSSLAQGQSESQRPRPLVQRLTQTGNSPLTGNQINQIPVSATLLGNNNNIQQSGDVLGDLAFLPRYPTISPLSIRRGTLLKGASIKVNIGGKVYAGFDTGEVDVRFLSDASGYLIPNPYNNSPDAPRLVKLYMDVAISAENPTANAGVTQNITQLELIGTALTDTKAGVININAVGVVTPEILGLERGYGTLSFQLQTYKDQTSAPTVVKDMTAPVLQSWTPGDNPERFKNGQPIALNYSEPLDPGSINKNNVNVYEDGVLVKSDAHANGATLLINVEGGLDQNKENDRHNYHVEIGSGITDLAGNEVSSQVLPSFELPVLVQKGESYPYTASGPPDFSATPTPFDVAVRSPIILSAFPGFPCVLDASTRDLSNNIAGRCDGSFPGLYSGNTGDRILAADDLIPVSTLSSNSPIIVQFSKDIDPNSVKLGSSFVVQSISEGGVVENNISGYLTINSKMIRFIPNQPWKSGQLYQYVVASNGDISSASAVCDGTQAICGMDGHPIQTEVYKIRFGVPKNTTGCTKCDRDNIIFQDETPSENGGPEFKQYFLGGNNSPNVIQTLSGASEDANANFYHEREERVTDEVQTASLMHKTYAVEEKGAENQPPDPHACENASGTCYDPQGVVPPPNSAKILSLKPDNALEQFTSQVSGANTGCGYAEIQPQSGLPAGIGIPLACPKQKFTYLNSALVAEITDQYVDGKGLKVEIWPGQIMSTSMRVRARALAGLFTIRVNTGPMILRMRYAKTDSSCVDNHIESPCSRTKPITGYIRAGANGKPVLTADVDLYLDALGLGKGFTAIGLVDVTSDLVSYPVSMSLEGAVDFSNDGSMVIDQFNLNDVDLDFCVVSGSGACIGTMNFQIPAYGSRLEYSSAVNRQ